MNYRGTMIEHRYLEYFQLLKKHKAKTITHDNERSNETLSSAASL